MCGFRGKRISLLLLLLVGAVNGSDIWGEFRDQRFPWSIVKAGTESNLSSNVRTVEVQSQSPLKTVSVQCGERNILVRVDTDLFGTKHLVKAADLTLGTVGCRPTAIFPQNHTIFFDYGLHECGSELQMAEDFLVYATHLNHRPQARGAIVVRTNRAIVPIRCRYFRKANVSSNPIHPTWMPFSSTRTGEGQLSFSLRLMTDDWLTERASSTYYLGELIHIEASVSMINHLPLKLHIDRCVATLSLDKDSTPRYNIIDHHGCLLDSATEDSFSTFVLAGADREVDKLRFDLDAFRFSGDERSLIFISCRLKVAAVNRSDSMNKACTFQKTQDTWTPLEETRLDVCACCRLGECAAIGEGVVSPRGRREARNEADDWLTEHASSTYYLGELIHIEASVSMINHVPLKLYIVATLSWDRDSTPRYNIIDHHGCLLDSAGADHEVDKLHFDQDNFRFFGN
ncbi:zona pellucida sperm-binding protein 3-like [Hypanus sabinus]|uniref:zona pellucida sperm-binding protein 3-like n=1 Tax=Hypanus sabinus TaxID=79690 RepID=UPI0028C3B9FD|nr:zona pellucida sperm-binding protein 3-like [Hypanus sabinus]